MSGGRTGGDICFIGIQEDTGWCFFNGNRTK